MMALNARAAIEGLAHRPDVVVALHVSVWPSASVIARCTRASLVLYAYGKELPHRKRLSRSALNGADATIAISSYTRDLCLSLGARQDRLTVIPPGTDLPVGSRVSRSHTAPLVVTVARLQERYKGHDVLLRAFQLLSQERGDARLVIIGDGPLRPSLEANSRELGLTERVQFLGSVTDAVRDEWLRRARVFAMPSRLPEPPNAGEGFGIVFIEAAARGLPVVGPNEGGPRDCVLDGETGIQVDPRDVDAVATAMARFLDSPDLADRMGTRAAAWVRQFAWSEVAAQVAEVIDLVHRQRKTAASN